jgi:hypothetical protein
LRNNDIGGRTGNAANPPTDPNPTGASVTAVSAHATAFYADDAVVVLG